MFLYLLGQKELGCNVDLPAALVIGLGACATIQQPEEPAEEETVEAEEELRTIGRESDTAVRIEVTNATNKDIVACSVKVSQDEEYPASLVTRSNMIEEDETIAILFEPEEAAQPEPASGADSDNPIANDVILNTLYNVSLTFDDDTTAVDWDDMKYTTGSPTNITLDQFYEIVFNAGTPQAYSYVKTGARTFSIEPLSKIVSATPALRGLPMSSSRGVSYTLTGNVTKEDAEDDQVTPVANGTNANNRFSVQLNYLGAKARLTMNQAASTFTGDDVADITTPTYTVKNLAKFTNLVANVTTGGVPPTLTPNVSQSYYHGEQWTGATQLTYQANFDQASNITVAVPASDGNFIFVPENTNATLLRGQSSFFAMKATYKPKYILKAVSYNPLVGAGTGSIAFPAANFDTWANLAPATAGAGQLAGGNQYYYHIDGIEGVNDATTVGATSTRVHYFANARVLADAMWVKANNKPLTDASYLTGGGAGAADQLLADAITAKECLIFTNGESYYRLDIGSGTGDATEYGVYRGNAYTANITNIAGPGVPDEGSLFDNPNDPVKAVTYINVSIETAEWHKVDQNGDLQ